MSGMGTTMPAQGEQGIDSSTAPVMAGSVADNPASIAQTTSAITLPVLQSDDYIWHNTYTVSTEMPPGTIFAIIPNHPEKCNYVSNHLSLLFNTWVGNMVLRFRLLATAFYGGSIRVAILPPSYTETEIANLPLQVLTAYQNTDLDPKNTIWNHCKSTDQREYAFHYNKPYDTTDRTTFGGYIVFFVAGKLVTQSPEISTIQMIVETKGEYIYDQPRVPPSVSLTKHPLADIVNIPLRVQPLAEAFLSANTLMVLPSTVNAITSGNLGHQGVGMQQYMQPGYLPEGATVTNINKFRYLTPKAYGKSKPIGHVHSDGAFYHPSSLPIYSYDEDKVQDPQYLQWTETSVVNPPQYRLAQIVWNNANDALIMRTSGFSISATQTGANELYESLALTGGGYTKKGIPTFTPMMARDTYETITYPRPSADSGVTLVPTVAGESIVLFAENNFGAYNTQTQLIAHALQAYPIDMQKSNTSWVYHLVNVNGTPILALRLNPNGVFTTNKANALVKYPISENDTKLRFVAELPVNDPLPPASVTMQAIRSELIYNARTKTTGALEASATTLSSY